MGEGLLEVLLAEGEFRGVLFGEFGETSRDVAM